MKINYRTSGKVGKGRCIYITVENWDSDIVREDVLDMNGKAPENLIQKLRDIANELEFNNDELKKLENG